MFSSWKWSQRLGLYILSNQIHTSKRNCNHSQIMSCRSIKVPIVTMGHIRDLVQIASIGCFHTSYQSGWTGLTLIWPFTGEAVYSTCCTCRVATMAIFACWTWKAWTVTVTGKYPIHDYFVDASGIACRYQKIHEIIEIICPDLKVYLLEAGVQTHFVATVFCHFCLGRISFDTW